MGTLFTIAITLIVVAIGAVGFFYAAYHTMHFDLPNMFIGAIIVLVALAILSAILGFTLPMLAILMI